MRNRFLASCWVIEDPPCSEESPWALVRSARSVPNDVDAEMLVEMLVLGGERRLDQNFRDLVERDRIVGADAAPADFVAVAVEEGDGVVLGLVEFAGGGDIEGRQRQRRHQHAADGQQGQPVRDEFDEKPPEAGDTEAVDEILDAGIALRRASGRSRRSRNRSGHPLRAAARGSSSVSFWHRRGLAQQKRTRLSPSPAQGTIHNSAR